MRRSATTSLQERPSQRRKIDLRDVSIDLYAIHSARRNESRMFAKAKAIIEASVFIIASSLEGLLQYRSDLDNGIVPPPHSDASTAELVRKRTKRAMKAKFLETGVAYAMDIINKATGTAKNFYKTRNGFSKNTLCCREQTHLPCGNRSLTVSGFSTGGVYNHNNIITGIYTESKGIEQTNESNNNAGREGNRSTGPFVQWGLPPSGSGEAKAGRIIVLWEKKHFSPVLHVLKGVYYILKEDVDSNAAAVLCLIEMNYFLKKRLNGESVEWRI